MEQQRGKAIEAQNRMARRTSWPAWVGSMERTTGLWLLLSVVSLITLVSAWGILVDAWPWLRGPAPWPPSWSWLHAPLGWERTLPLVLHGLFLIGYVATVLMMTRASSRLRIRSMLLVAALFTIVWQLAQT